MFVKPVKQKKGAASFASPFFIAINLSTFINNSHNGYIVASHINGHSVRPVTGYFYLRISGFAC
jgi:hypothetical protein